MTDKPNLVSTWLELTLQRQGGTVADVLRDLNEKLHTRTRHSRLSAWRAGRARPNGDLVWMMLLTVLTEKLEEAGLDRKTINSVLETIQF